MPQCMAAGGLSKALRTGESGHQTASRSELQETLDEQRDDATAAGYLADSSGATPCSARQQLPTQLEHLQLRNLDAHSPGPIPAALTAAQGNIASNTAVRFSNASAALCAESIEALKVLVWNAVQEGENMACATAAEMQDWLQARYGSRFAEANADKATHAGESALSRRRRRHQASEGNGTVLRRINGSRPLRHNLALQEETWLKVQWHPADKEHKLQKAWQTRNWVTCDEVLHNLEEALIAGRPGMFASGAPITHRSPPGSALVVFAVADLQKSVSAGRVRELLSLTQPATLGAWLTNARLTATHRYILGILVKEGKLDSFDLGSGRFTSLIRYRTSPVSLRPASGPPLAAVNSARKHLKRLAIATLPPRRVEAPKRARPSGVNDCAPTTSANGGESGGANQFDRGGDDAASALTASAAAEQTLRRRLELRAFKHHALLFDLK